MQKYYEDILKITENKSQAWNIAAIKFGLIQNFHMSCGKDKSENYNNRFIGLMLLAHELIKFDNNLCFCIENFMSIFPGVFVSLHTDKLRCGINFTSSTTVYNTKLVGEKLGHISPGTKNEPNTILVSYLVDDENVYQEWVKNTKIDIIYEKFSRFSKFTEEIGKKLVLMANPQIIY